MERELAHALNEAANLILSESNSAALLRDLEDDPDGLARKAKARVEALLRGTLDSQSISAQVNSQPYSLLVGAFEIDDLPTTPVDFYPIPACKTTLRARIVALAVHALLGVETVSYRSENIGELFVNLVSMPGEGRLAEKSTKAMRGHTDAVSFPFANTKDPRDSRISPSPDLVTLIGLKNPDSVSTTLMPLDRILSHLDSVDIQELCKDQFVIECQNTFRKGTVAVLGAAHRVSAGAILHLTESRYNVRYSHSKVVPDPDYVAAQQARDRFDKACANETEPVTVNAGSLLIINNRIALHGRAEVAAKYGGDTRWLLRTYGLAREAARQAHRYADKGYQLFP
jgi:hypothetical protein